MTPDLVAIKARLAAATPGPWGVVWDMSTAYGNACNIESTVSNVADSHVCEVGCTRMTTGADVEGDAILIAHAPADLAACVEEIERLTEENAQLGGAYTAITCVTEGCEEFMRPKDRVHGMCPVCARAEIERLQGIIGSLERVMQEENAATLEMHESLKNLKELGL